MFAVAGISSLLKWPNDVVVQSRKIAGILAEASYEGSKLNRLIVGLGVNANIKTTLFPKELRESATSINRELGREIDRILLTRKILEEMDNAYRKFESGEATELLREVKGLCSTLGRMVEVTTVEGKFRGEALDIGEDGQLIIRLGNGATVPLYAADIVHLR
jgi:BirA family biotin operon repressor/biotin-[acetyl-CoA-carboxylase] ligase